MLTGFHNVDYLISSQELKVTKVKDKSDFKFNLAANCFLNSVSDFSFASKKYMK